MKDIARKRVAAAIASIGAYIKWASSTCVTNESGKRILRCSFYIDLTDTELTAEDIGEAFSEYNYYNALEALMPFITEDLGTYIVPEYEKAIRKAIELTGYEVEESEGDK